TRSMKVYDLAVITAKRDGPTTVTIVMKSDLIAFLEQLPEATEPAFEQRFGLELEADFAGTAVQQDDVADGAVECTDDFEERLGGFVFLAVVHRDGHFSAATPAKSYGGKRLWCAGDDVPRLHGQFDSSVTVKPDISARNFLCEQTVGILLHDRGGKFKRSGV